MDPTITDGNETLADVFHRRAMSYLGQLGDEWNKAWFEMRDEGYAAYVLQQQIEAIEVYDQCMQVWAAFNLTLALCPEGGIKVQSFRDMQAWMDQYVGRSTNTSSAGHMERIFAQCWAPLVAVRPAATVH